MSFSFIVPVKNGLAYTRALVQTVREMNPGAEIEWVIVDSGSTDGTPEFCASIGARVVPFSRTPFNYCAAVNAGAAAATGDLWLISNNDIEFRSPGDLSRLERLFRDWPLLAVVSPGRAEGRAELEFRLSGINGACWAVRPQAFRLWGGMPESLSGYGYDEAFTEIQCWRHGLAQAWLTGWDVLHHGSVTFGAEGGNVTPALRRNLSRLLAQLGASDFDTAAHPNTILARLHEREIRRAPCRLRLPESWRGPLEPQGYANARAGGPDADEASRVILSNPVAGERQWLPWLANELLLQPEAAVVGTEGVYALRAGAPEASLESLDEWLDQARTVGPVAPEVMASIPTKRATLRQRLSAVLYSWRRRHQKLPDEW